MRKKKVSDKHNNMNFIFNCEKENRSVRVTHVESDSDDVEAHGRVCDTAEGWRLERKEDTEHIVNKSGRKSILISSLIYFSRPVSMPITAETLTSLRCAYPVYFGHFVPPSAPLVSAHQLWRRTLFCGATEPETQKSRGRGKAEKDRIWERDKRCAELFM